MLLAGYFKIYSAVVGRFHQFWVFLHEICHQLPYLLLPEEPKAS